MWQCKGCPNHITDSLDTGLAHRDHIALSTPNSVDHSQLLAGDHVGGWWVSSEARSTGLDLSLLGWAGRVRNIGQLLDLDVSGAPRRCLLGRKDFTSVSGKIILGSELTRQSNWQAGTWKWEIESPKLALSLMHAALVVEHTMAVLRVIPPPPCSAGREVREQRSDAPSSVACCRVVQ